MRTIWRPEIPHGTAVDITSARKPEWVAENKGNPPREWADREHITKARYSKAVAQYKATRRAVQDELCSEPTEDQPARLTQIGREYGEAFNQLDGRRPFIETVEREELFAALEFIIDEAGSTGGRNLTAARSSLINGVEAVREW